MTDISRVERLQKTIRDTFSLEEVPRQAYYMGMAGVLPYMATSLSTVYCAYEINHAAEFGTGYLMSEKYAEALLHVIEPVQVGYGAVVSDHVPRPSNLPVPRKWHSEESVFLFSE